MSKTLKGQTEISNDGHWDISDEIEVEEPLSEDEANATKNQALQLMREWQELTAERRTSNQRFNVRIKEKFSEATRLSQQDAEGVRRLKVPAIIRFYPDNKTKMALDRDTKEPLWDKPRKMTPADFEMRPNEDQGDQPPEGE